MMYEELITQMRFCTEDHSVVECAEKCPYANAERQHGYCFLDLMATAADAIEELQADKAALNGTVTNLLEQIKDIARRNKNDQIL